MLCCCIRTASYLVICWQSVVGRWKPEAVSWRCPRRYT